MLRDGCCVVRVCLSRLTLGGAVVGLFSAERPLKKDESFREDRRKMEPTGISPRGGNPVHRSGPAARGVHPLHPPQGLMGPPGGRGGSGSHKDIKLTLLNKVNVAPASPW